MRLRVTSGSWAVGEEPGVPIVVNLTGPGPGGKQGWVVSGWELGE